MKRKLVFLTLLLTFSLYLPCSSCFASLPVWSIPLQPGISYTTGDNLSCTVSLSNVAEDHVDLFLPASVSKVKEYIGKIEFVNSEGDTTLSQSGIKVTLSDSFNKDFFSEFIMNSNVFSATTAKSIDEEEISIPFNITQADGNTKIFTINLKRSIDPSSQLAYGVSYPLRSVKCDLIHNIDYYIETSELTIESININIPTYCHFAFWFRDLDTEWNFSLEPVTSGGSLSILNFNNSIFTDHIFNSFTGSDLGGYLFHDSTTIGGLSQSEAFDALCFLKTFYKLDGSKANFWVGVNIIDPKKKDAPSTQ